MTGIGVSMQICPLFQSNIKTGFMKTTGWWVGGETKDWIDEIFQVIFTAAMYFWLWKYRSFVAAYKAADVIDSLIFVRRNLIPLLSSAINC